MIARCFRLKCKVIEPHPAFPYVVKKITMIMTTRIDPVDVIEMMTMKTWISPAPRTGDVIVTMMMTNLLCVVVGEDGECDGTGSLLFQ